jgi:hypothetical protein
MLGGCNWSGTACEGTPTACDALTQRMACETAGCGWIAPCQGTPPACDSLDAANLCNGVPGCTWDAGACTGTADACTDYINNATCTNVAGCAWVACQGGATECSELDATACVSQPGCSIQ